MESELGKAISRARRMTGLTQAELATRVGVTGQSVSHWEAGHTTASRSNCSALVSAISAINPAAGAELARAMNDPKIAPLPVAAPPLETSLQSPSITLQLAILTMSDALDLPPRRVRAAVAQLMQHLQAGGISIETARRELEDWTASTEMERLARATRDEELRRKAAE